MALLASDAGQMDRPASLNALAAEQMGVVSRRQLSEHGVSIGQIRWRLGRSWRQLLPGVVLLGTSLPTAPQRYVAAQIYGGPHCWLAGPTAAALFGFVPDDADRRVHVLVPLTSKPRLINGVIVRRTRLMNERLVQRGPLRLSCRPRAVIDAAAVLPEPDARSLVIDVVRRRLVRLDDLTHWVEVRQTRGRIRLRRMVVEAAAGAWSVPEADLAALVRTSRVLPTPWLNPGLEDETGIRLTTPDVWFDDVGMAVMIHSRQFHAGILQWDATVTDDSELSSYRIVVVGVTPEQLVKDPPSVLRRIEDHYATARRSGFRPAVVATPRQEFRMTG
jgi:hypothetical protein